MNHERYLLFALAEAIKGKGLCAPNPSVGAIAVRNGEIIAKDFHRKAGSEHAEILVMKQIPKNTDNVILYVTLEPCNHWGKPPPCVDAIIAHGISAVYYGYRDPNTLVKNNDTPMLLQQKGINATYIQVNEIDEFYNSYQHWHHTGKPFVTAKIAQTLDEKIAGINGRAYKISNSLCDEFTHLQRKQTDVILTSAKTINNDEPLLNARIGMNSYAKNIAVIDTHHILNSQAQFYHHAQNIHIFCSKPPKSPSQQKNVSYHEVSANMEGLLMKEVISHLGQLGYHDVWVEAGATIFSKLHEEQLVDRTYIYISPKIMGEQGVSYSPLNCFPDSKQMTWSVMGDNLILKIDWANQKN